MGDKVQIPRSFSGDFGATDIRPSLGRHYIPIQLMYPLNNTTTGGMFGADSNTTGFAFLQRNLTLERLFVTGYEWTTVNNSTTLLTLQMHKNGVSTLFDLNVFNSTTQGLRWMQNATTPAIANLVATDRVSARIVTRNGLTTLSATLVCRERVDS